MFLISCNEIDSRYEEYGAYNPGENFYKLAWNLDTNFVFFRNLKNKTFIRDTTKGNIKSVIIDNHDLISKYSNTTIRSVYLKNSTLLFPKDSTDYGTLNINLLKDAKPIIGNLHSLKDKYIKKIYLNNLNAGRLDLAQNDTLNLEIQNCNFDNLYFESLMARRLFGDSLKKNHCPLLDLYWKNDHSLTKEINIENKEIGDLFFGNTRFVRISSSVINKKSTIFCGDLNALMLIALDFKDQKSILKLSSAYKTIIKPYKNTFFVKLSDEKYHTDLYLFECDVKRLDLDYQFFTYRTGNFREYSDVIKNFADIISMQRRLNYQEGLKNAIVDSCIFQDKQYIIATIFIPIKLWWNNYGQDKPKVISSALQVFGIVWLINLIFFKELLEVYTYPEILEVLKIPINPLSFFKIFRKSLFTSLIYSGYLFWGLKLDFNKLKLDKPLAAIWIIVQYLAGLISLGYFANLIITK